MEPVHCFLCGEPGRISATLGPVLQRRRRLLPQARAVARCPVRILVRAVADRVTILPVQRDPARCNIERVSTYDGRRRAQIRGPEDVSYLSPPGGTSGRVGNSIVL